MIGSHPNAGVGVRLGNPGSATVSFCYSAVCIRLIKVVGLISFFIYGVYSLAVMPGCSERLGFDRQLRHRIFFRLPVVTYLTHYYIWLPMFYPIP